VVDHQRCFPKFAVGCASLDLAVDGQVDESPTFLWPAASFIAPRQCYTASRVSHGPKSKVRWMREAAEWVALITCTIIGFSHIFQPRAWADVYARLFRLDKPGAFINGGLCLLPGAVYVVVHPVWSWPAVVLTVFGWLLVIKGAMCLIVPNLALRSMGKAGASTGREFVAGGLLLLGIAAAIGYALWIGSRS
jgi:hypothetical protein